MNYQEFTKEICNLMQAKATADVHYLLSKKTGYNNQHKVGLCCHREDQKCSPVIYLEHFYEKYQNGELLEDICSELSELLETIPIPSIQDGIPADYEEAKPHILMKLINTKENQDFLKTVPHKPFLDLSVVYFYLFQENVSSIMSSPVLNSWMDMWKIDVETLHLNAVKNYQSFFQTDSFNLNNFLAAALPKAEQLQFRLVQSTAPRITVLTNKDCVWGAAQLIIPEILEEQGNLIGENYFIIPSSLHTLLLVPASEAPFIPIMNLIIQDVNQTSLDPEEILSDHVYFYDRTTKEVASCA